MSLNFILADAAPKTVSIGPGAPAQAGNAAVSNAVKATETVAVDPAAAAGQEQPPQQVPFFANPIILMLVVLGVMVLLHVPFAEEAAAEAPADARRHRQGDAGHAEQRHLRHGHRGERQDLHGRDRRPKWWSKR